MSTAERPIEEFAGLDLLSSAVILLDGEQLIRHLNPAAENLFSASQRVWLGRPLSQLLGTPPALLEALDNALRNNWSYTGHSVPFKRSESVVLHLDCTVTPIEATPLRARLPAKPRDSTAAPV